jgi:hypothetical protein
VGEYIEDYRDGARDLLRFYAQQPTVAAAIRAAALCHIDDVGTRSPHQRRRSQATLDASARTLIREGNRLQRCDSFDCLLNTVASLVADIPDLGELYSYDTALHIGARTKRLPDSVYLHAGTRLGAKALRLPYRQKSLDVASLPASLRVLKPYEIEDFLCIYKDRLHSSMA